MDNSKEDWMFWIGFVGFWLMFMALFDGHTWIDRLIGIGSGIACVGINSLIILLTKKPHEWKELLGISALSLFCGLALAGALIGCNRCMTPEHHNYPYHDIETGRGQYEYGGSEEQMQQLIDADASLTDEEKAMEAEYEAQVERELGR